MRSIRQLITEVHRRSLWQVLSIYLVGSWIGYQVILNLTQGVGLPSWVPAFAVVLFIIGLPIVLATAFVQEGVPGARGRGKRRRRSRAGAERAAAGTTPAATRRDAAQRQHWLLTWQRAVLGGIIAFLLLGITAGGYMGARSAGIGPFGALIAAGKLDERDRVLIADFGASDADIELADALTQAFRIDLAQSPVVNVVEPRYTRELLQRMGRDGAARIDAELAREAALRDGIKAVITGDVSRAGRGYVLSASLVTPDDGGVLAAFRESAADSAAVLSAVDRLSRRLRERIGESLRSVNRSAALPAVTTTSLEALRRYTRGVHALDRDLDFNAAVPLFEEAIALDSTFGMAWRKLAVAYFNFGGGRDRVARAATKAYELRDGMSPREREHAVAFYHINVTGDERAAIQAYRSLLELYPDDGAALHNVAMLHERAREFDLAVDYYLRAIDQDSTRLVSYTNLASVYTETDRLDDTERLLQLYTAKFGETSDALLRRVHLEARRGNFDAALDAARRIRELRRGDAYLRTLSENLQSEIHALHGRLDLARRHREEAMAAAIERGNDWAPLLVATWEARRDVLLRRMPAAALQRLDRAVEAHPVEQFPPLSRQYRELANAYAAAGHTERARFWLNEEQRAVPPEQRAEDRETEARTAVWLAWADGDDSGALRLIDRLEEVDSCLRCVAQWRARVLDRMEDDRAIAEYERYLATPYMYMHPDVVFLAPTHERLAELYAERGDDANAARHAARFIELWTDADAELQPRVAAKRALLRDLRTDR
jgi:tetratricopeptide (TPR) repeat protein